MADGRATKIVVPTELAGIAGSLTAVAELLNGGGNSSNGDTHGDVPAPPPDPPAIAPRPGNA